MATTETSLYKIGYPVYTIKFMSDDKLVVAGGGGYLQELPNRLVSV